MNRRTSVLAGLAALLSPLGATAHAQTLPYASSATSDGAADKAGGDMADDKGESAPRLNSGKRLPGARYGGKRERLRLSPYIEAQQVLSAELSPGHDVLTWTALAAGIDGSVRGRSAEGTFSLRYERRIGWGKADSGDAISGLVRGGATVIPGALSIEAGALATRTSVQANGSSLPGSFDRSNSTHLYSVYAGPNLSTHAGDVGITGSYRIGYTEVGTSQQTVSNGTASRGDLFDHSVVQNAELHAGVRPGDVLPVGLGAGAGFYQEDVANLDQRVRDLHARVDATLPVSPTVALVGGVGYEKVEVSSRDALRDANGAPVVGANGRYVTDKSQPRQIAYDTSGLIWDAGVTWRPNSRTALEAHVGWRYGGTTYYGAFGWLPSRRSSVNVSVYSSISGYGGMINRALVQLPREFTVQRDPIGGDITGCVATLDQGACLTGAFGSLRSATFRARGIQGSYARQLGRFSAGIAAGYDRRTFIAAPGTILAAANGVSDENTWLSAWFNGQLSRQTTFSTFLYADWFRSGFVLDGDGTALGVSGGLMHRFDNHISGNASLSLQGIQREQGEDLWNAYAQVGVRYAF